MRKLKFIEDSLDVSGRRIRVDRFTNEDLCSFRVRYHHALLLDHIHKHFNMILVTSFMICLVCFRMILMQDILKAWLGISMAWFAAFSMWANYVSVYEEKVTFVQDLGVQISVTFLSGRSCDEFIPLKCISDIAIAEVVYMQRIIYTLVVFVGEARRKLDKYPEKNYSGIIKTVTLFKGFKPRLEQLVVILNYAHGILQKE